MTRLALAALTAALISTSALAQTANQSGPPLPANPNASSGTSSDENGISPTATPGAAPDGGIMDSTRSGDNGAYARRNSGTTGQGNASGATNGSSTNGSPVPERHPTDK
jgi:hypothetical protein